MCINIFEISDPSTHGNLDAGVEGVAVVEVGVADVQMPMVPLFLVMITIVLMRMDANGWMCLNICE